MSFFTETDDEKKDLWFIFVYIFLRFISAFLLTFFFFCGILYIEL